MSRVPPLISVGRPPSVLERKQNMTTLPLPLSIHIYFLFNSLFKQTAWWRHLCTPCWPPPWRLLLHVAHPPGRLPACRPLLLLWGTAHAGRPARHSSLVVAVGAPGTGGCGSSLQLAPCLPTSPPPPMGRRLCGMTRPSFWPRCHPPRLRLWEVVAPGRRHPHPATPAHPALRHPSKICVPKNHPDLCHGIGDS
jgi:hypothetical protein